MRSIAALLVLASCGSHAQPGMSSDANERDAGNNVDSTGPADDAATPPIGLVMFSGNAGDLLDDQWMWNATSGWSEQHPSNNPGGRADYMMASLGHTLVLFGGAVDEDILADTWIYDGTTWTAGPTGPGERWGAAIATLGDRIVLFGGQDHGGSLGDTWTFDGAHWTQLQITGPAARNTASMATLGDHVVLFGGTDAHESFADTWSFDGAHWTKLDVSGPSERNAAAMAACGHELVLFGGMATAPSAETWTFDGTSWTQHTGTAPGPRLDAAIGSLGETAVLFGGEDVGDNNPGQLLGDTWTWDGAQWTRATTPSAGIRDGMQLAPLFR